MSVKSAAIGACRLRSEKIRTPLIFATLVMFGLLVSASAQDAASAPDPAAPFRLRANVGPTPDLGTGLPFANPGPSPPSSPSEGQTQIEAARQRHAEWLSCVLTRRLKCNKESVSGPMDTLLNDETLVVGDVVSTPHGLKVFRGPSQIPHRWDDFQ
jgi:hypothetical protein